jgi:hypothetical protein
LAFSAQAGRLDGQNLRLETEVIGVRRRGRVVVTQTTIEAWKLRWSSKGVGHPLGGLLKGQE